ncbi:hypothetical protein D3C77_608810 [compost metagenome]
MRTSTNSSNAKPMALCKPSNQVWRGDKSAIMLTPTNSMARISTAISQCSKRASGWKASGTGFMGVLPVAPLRGCGG